MISINTISSEIVHIKFYHQYGNSIAHIDEVKAMSSKQKVNFIGENHQTLIALQD